MTLPLASPSKGYQPCQLNVPKQTLLFFFYNRFAHCTTKEKLYTRQKISSKYIEDVHTNILFNMYNASTRDTCRLSSLSIVPVPLRSQRTLVTLSKSRFPTNKYVTMNFSTSLTELRLINYASFSLATPDGIFITSIFITCISLSSSREIASLFLCFHSHRTAENHRQIAIEEKIIV